MMRAYVSSMPKMYLYTDVTKPSCCKVCADLFLDAVERRLVVVFFAAS